MNFYKVIEDGYIVAIGINIGGVEIEKSEYEQLMDIIRNKPIAADGCNYRLNVNLGWDEYTETCEFVTN
jgi:hypothetical protein